MPLFPVPLFICDCAREVGEIGKYDDFFKCLSFLFSPTTKYFVAKTKTTAIYKIHRSLICFCVVMKLNWNAIEQAAQNRSGRWNFRRQTGCLWKLSDDKIEPGDDEINKVTSMAWQCSKSWQLSKVDIGESLENCDLRWGWRFVVGKTTSQSVHHVTDKVKLKVCYKLWHQYGRKERGG